MTNDAKAREYSCIHAAERNRYPINAFLRNTENKDKRIMKKIVAGTLIAVLAALLSLACSVSAGTLTITSGPIFTPDTAFTDNSIKQDTTVGNELIRIRRGRDYHTDPSRSGHD